MELSPLAFVIFAGVPLWLGSSILRSLALGLCTDRVAYLGWVWMTGALAVGVLEALRLLAHLATPWPVVGPALLLAGVLRFRARATPVLADAEPGAAGRGERVFFGAVLALVLVVMLYRTLASSLSAVVASDEGNFWALRAKLLFDGQGFGGPYAAAIASRDFHNANYPLLNSLLQLWVYDCAGQITHVANRLPIQLCSFALVLCAAAAFRRASRAGIAALLLVVLANCAPIEAGVRRAYADVLVGFAGLVAADALRRRRRTDDAREQHAWLGLGTLALAFLLASKREGLLLLGCGLAALAVWSWRRGTLRRPSIPRGALPWLVLLILVQLGTLLHNAWFAAHGSHELELGLLERTWNGLDAVPHVLSHLASLATRPSMAAIPAACLLLGLVGWVRSWGGTLAFVPLACVFFLLALIVALIQGNTQYLLNTASLRVVSQLLPLQLLWIASVARELLVRRAPNA